MVSFIAEALCLYKLKGGLKIMKFNFKKIVSVLATTIMLGSTVAFAAAAYPEPFVKSGSADAAIVVGASAATTDMAAATDLGTSLDAGVTATTGISGEGDKYLLEKTSTKMHVGSAIGDIITSALDDSEMPILLKEGKYIDDDNDEFDYTQKINLGNQSITLFDDNDYKTDTPTVGIKYASGAVILNYTLDFTDNTTWGDLETSDIPILGKDYYVLTVTDTNGATLTLLDSAEKIILAEGETKTVTIGSKTYECSISYISTTEVKLTINGQTTNSLAEKETFKLSDGTYIGVRDILARDVAGVAGQVEFGIGSGKLKLSNNADVEINDESISRLKVNITNGSSGLKSIRLDWKADGDKFVASGSEVTMPGFGNVKLIWSGVESGTVEDILVKGDASTNAVLENFPLTSGNTDIHLVYTDNLNYTGIGKDADNILRTSDNKSLIFDLDTDAYFVASWSDSRDSESYLMKASGLTTSNGINRTDFFYMKDGEWAKAADDVKTGDTVSPGSVEMTVLNIHYEDKTVGISTAGDNFNVLYSNNGMKLILPWVNVTKQNQTLAMNIAPIASCNNATFKFGQIGPVNISVNGSGVASTTCYQDTWKLSIMEEDKDGNINAGENINVTLGFNSASTKQTQVTAIAGGDGTDSEVGASTEIRRNFVYSSHATEYLWNKKGDQDYVTLMYPDEERQVKLYVASSSVTSGAEKIKVVTDAETSSVSGMNLIVVGGACINKAAAMIVNNAETALCGDAWATKTGAGAGKYLIQIAASPYNAGKIAMLVAGYDAADTTNAIAKVKEGSIDTSKNSATVYPLATA